MDRLMESPPKESKEGKGERPTVFFTTTVPIDLAKHSSIDFGALLAAHKKKLQEQELTGEESKKRKLSDQSDSSEGEDAGDEGDEEERDAEGEDEKEDDEGGAGGSGSLPARKRRRTEEDQYDTKDDFIDDDEIDEARPEKDYGFVIFRGEGIDEYFGQNVDNGEDFQEPEMKSRKRKAKEIKETKDPEVKSKDPEPKPKEPKKAKEKEKDKEKEKEEKEKEKKVKKDPRKEESSDEEDVACSLQRFREALKGRTLKPTEVLDELPEDVRIHIREACRHEKELLPQGNQAAFFKELNAILFPIPEEKIRNFVLFVLEDCKEILYKKFQEEFMEPLASFCDKIKKKLGTKKDAEDSEDFDKNSERSDAEGRPLVKAKLFTWPQRCKQYYFEIIETGRKILAVSEAKLDPKAMNDRETGIKKKENARIRKLFEENIPNGLQGSVTPADPANIYRVLKKNLTKNESEDATASTEAIMKTSPYFPEAGND